MVQSNWQQKLAIARSMLWKNLLTSLSGISTTALLWSIATPSAYAQFVPEGLDPGDTYHLVFVSEGNFGAFLPNIGPYNDFIQGEAERNPDLTGTNQGIIYNVIGSTIADNVSAFNNALVEAPVYTTNGNLVATGFDDLWDGTLLNPISITQFGVGADQGIVEAATGTNFDGTISNFPLGNFVVQTVRLGDFQSISTEWVSDAVGPNLAVAVYRYYGLSQKLTVPDPDLGLLDNLVRAELSFEDPVPVLNETETVIDPGVEFSFLNSDILFEVV